MWSIVSAVGTKQPNESVTDRNRSRNQRPIRDTAHRPHAEWNRVRKGRIKKLQCSEREGMHGKRAGQGQKNVSGRTAGGETGFSRARMPFRLPAARSIPISTPRSSASPAAIWRKAVT